MKPPSKTDAGPRGAGDGRSYRTNRWRSDRRGGGSEAGWRPRPQQPGTVDHGDGVIRIFGLHPVEAVFANPARTVRRILATENALRKLEALVGKSGVTPEPATPRELDRLLGSDTVHQGVMLEVGPLPEPELATLAETARSQGRPLIVLDQVTDPHNVGAVLRSAAVFGAAGLVMTRRHSPPLNGTLAKAASGALELVPIALVQNLGRALAELKDAGIQIVALDGNGERSLDEVSLAAGAAIVLGAEGKGLRQSTREAADLVVHIATGGLLNSLNVSNAAAIALHLGAMQRKSKAAG